MGGCGCILLIALLTAAIFIALYLIGKNAQEKAGNGSSEAPTTTSTPTATNASGMSTFVSSPDNIPPELRDKFVRFQFSYPSKFKVVPASGGNFVKIEESMVEGGKVYTMENFAVGYMVLPSADADNSYFYPKLMTQLSEQFASQSGFENYVELAQSSETVAGHPARVMAFEAKIGETPIYGSTILMREQSSARGVTLILLATPKDPAIKSVSDVGVKGDLPGILASFKFLPST